MQIVIDPRFCGPPSSANGGYACGLIAGAVEGPAEVTLKRPPPLGRPLRLARDGEGAALYDGETLVGVGAPAAVDVVAPAPVSLAEAEVAMARYPGFTGHPFPTCFVCGPNRQPGDGLRLFTGPVEGRDLAAAPWRPDASVCDADGLVEPACVWAALDCPSYFGIVARTGALPLALLGRLAARIEARPRAGEPCVVVGWSLGADGRKLPVGSALFSVERGLLALASGLWITVKETPRPT